MNHQMKKMKYIHLLQEGQGKHISPKKTLRHQQKAILHLNPKNLSIQKTKRINATKLTFSISKKRRDTVGISESLIKAIGFPKNTQELYLNLPSSFKNQDLPLLAQSLKRFKSLKRLTLECDDVHNITDEGLCALMKGLRRLCYLKGIKLEIYRWEKITNAGLNFASQTLKRMTSLEGIYLDFSISTPRITAEGLLKLNGSLNRLKRLKNIVFKIPNCKEITDKSLMKMNWRRLVDLQETDLTFGGYPQLTDVTAVGVDLITKSLKGLANLESIRLELSDCTEFNDLGLRCIWEMMNSLPSLKKIALDFLRIGHITDAGFSDMNETLKCLDSLHDLSIKFYECWDITDSGLSYLCKALEKAVSLQNLYIAFTDSEEITDVSVKKLINCIKKLPGLRNIGLDFNGDKRLTKASFKNVIQFLQSLTGPETITIGFGELEQISEKERNDFFRKVTYLQWQKTDVKIEIL